MQDKIARSYKTGRSWSRESKQSRLSLESETGIKTWRAGFVKPDGTRIELFNPQQSALQSGVDLKEIGSRLVAFLRAVYRRIHRPHIPVTRKATPV